MIARFKAFAKRHWPRLGLRTVLLSTFILVAALPGFGALFLRVYENTVVRQTESELIAESVALSAATAADWPGFAPFRADAVEQDQPPAVDLRGSAILPDRPASSIVAGNADPAARAAAIRMAPVFDQSARATSISILLLDATGRIVTGPLAGRSYAALPEVVSALRGTSATILRRNAVYRPAFPIAWFSRSADLRLHHAQPVRVNGLIVGVLLLSRAPPPLYLGLYMDAGKIGLGVIVILAIIVILSRILSRGIVRPIERLGVATRDLARGATADIPAVPEMAAVEIQALYADFATMAAAIEQRSRYLRDFAYAVSHEFKTPLAGIRGVVEILQDHHAAMSDDERRRFLGNAATDADRLTLLVTRLLELARADMTSGGTESSLLAPVLRQLADAYANSAFAIDLSLPKDSVPRGAASAATIEAVIGSLIDNSRRAGAGHCRISVAVAGGFIRIDVCDDGPGIAPADRDRLFEPFFTTRRAEGGTGLGLPIARSLLHASGGTIELNLTDQGTCFRVALPEA